MPTSVEARRIERIVDPLKVATEDFLNGRGSCPFDHGFGNNLKFTSFCDIREFVDFGVGVGVVGVLRRFFHRR